MDKTSFNVPVSIGFSDLVCVPPPSGGRNGTTDVKEHAPVLVLTLLERRTAYAVCRVSKGEWQAGEYDEGSKFISDA